MYTGTLINDLMAAVERAEQAVQQKLMFKETERDQIFRRPDFSADRSNSRGSGIMATAAAALRMAVPAARRNTFFTGTPEILFRQKRSTTRVW